MNLSLSNELPSIERRTGPLESREVIDQKSIEIRKLLTSKTKTGPTENGQMSHYDALEMDKIPQPIRDHPHFWYLVWEKYHKDVFRQKAIKDTLGHPKLMVDPIDQYRSFISAGRIALDGALDVYLHERDALTGLQGRGLFEAEMDTLNGQETREYPMAMVIVDLDDLKGVNDAYGHPAGDEIIHQLGKKLDLFSKTYLGKDADGFRYGGEEFTMLVPLSKELTLEAFLRKLEEMVIQITKDPYLLPTFGGGTVQYPLSLSVGYDLFEGAQKKKASDVFAQADGALYFAKSTKLGKKFGSLRQDATSNKRYRYFIRRYHPGDEIKQAEPQVVLEPELAA